MRTEIERVVRMRGPDELVVQERRARSTGTPVQVIDNRTGDFDDGGLPWITLCVEHGNYCEHETRSLATGFAPAPEEWCENCRTAIEVASYGRDLRASRYPG